jgi:RHS repeat-associated protein
MTEGPDLTDVMAVVESRSLTFNADNMPTSVVHPTGGTVNITYDGEAKRAKKSGPGGTTYYFSNAFEQIGTTETCYVFAGNLRVAMVKDHTTVTYFHKDHLGSSSVVTDENGDAKEQTRYMPFGGKRGEAAGITASNYLFTDQELDQDSGLYNYDARLYDPVVGRFVSADTIVPDWYYSQTLDRYSYCYNQPIIYIDPDGHIVGIPGVIAGAVAGAFSGAISGINASSKTGAVVGAIVGGVVGATVGSVNALGSAAAASTVGAAAVGALSGAAGGVVGGATARGVATGISAAEEGKSLVDAAVAGLTAAKNPSAIGIDAVSGAAGGVFSGLAGYATEGLVGTTTAQSVADFSVAQATGMLASIAHNTLGNDGSSGSSLSGSSFSGGQPGVGNTGGGDYGGAGRGPGIGGL